MNAYKNLIFDLGNVIVDIDFNKVVVEFQKISNTNFSELLSYQQQHQLFDLFEVGKISAQQLRDELKKFLKPNITDEQIDFAWNSIITGYPEEKFSMLSDLKKHYKTFALSNTNEIHVATMDKALKEKFGTEGIKEFFTGIYYSNQLGMRKPDKEIFEFVLKKENLKPERTFFIDDKTENVEAAKRLGIQAFRLADRNKLRELLAELKII